MDTNSITLMLVVGEPSGDALGAQLMAGLKEIMPPPGRIHFCGVGGALMEAEGLKSLFSLDDTSVMGLREVVPKIPAILNRVVETTAFAIENRPDAVVLIDSPDFTHRIARRIKRLAPDVTIIKYVAPQVWASRPWRAKQLRFFVDHLLALLPFEPAFFEAYGVATHFVGHPVVERVISVPDADIDGFRTRYGLQRENTTVLAVLPGSRANEIRFLGPIFSKVVKRIAADTKGLRIFIPTIPSMREHVEALVADWPGKPVTVVDSKDKWCIFNVAQAGLAASGTVTTEAALAGLPLVVGYKVGWLTEVFARILMVSPYMTLLNLIARKEIIPEFLPWKISALRLVQALKPLLIDTEERRTQMRAVSDAVEQLRSDGQRPSLRAAEKILSILTNCAHTEKKGSNHVQG